MGRGLGRIENKRGRREKRAAALLTPGGLAVLCLDAPLHEQRRRTFDENFNSSFLVWLALQGSCPLPCAPQLLHSQMAQGAGVRVGSILG